MSCKSQKSCPELTKAFEDCSAEENRPHTVTCIGLSAVLKRILHVEHAHLANHDEAASLSREDHPGRSEDAEEKEKEEEKEEERLERLICEGPESTQSLRAFALLSGNFETTRQFAAYIGALLMNTVLQSCTHSVSLQI